ncbi:polysaccharide pyruvyl transferase family protein [Aliiglaciecola sp. SL4]|uniref:polysaccharide pyruvyl transferase family protein n=1 Tax=Aliiglaciecola sp. SL4 TaxID=3239806 RepID=UPI00355BB81C
MRLGFFETATKNVGDDLNPYLWHKFFPNLTNANKDSVLIAIGSVLDNRFDDYKHKVVFGTGARTIDSVPKIDESWDIRFVRGPNTQKALAKQGVKVKYITDPAILAANYFKKSNQAKEIGLIPYFRTEQTPWHEIADKLGYQLISPCTSVDNFMNALSSCKLVITEAMHGAILADTLRIPWIPYTSFTSAYEGETHHFKWVDWCQSMELEHQEIVLKRFWQEELNSLKGKLKRELKKYLITTDLRKAVAQNHSFLSSENVFKDALSAMEIEINTLKTRYDL